MTSHYIFVLSNTEYWAYLRYIDSGPEEFQMFSHLGSLVFRVEDGQLREHAHVRALQTQSRLQQADQLIKVTSVLQLIVKLL